MKTSFVALAISLAGAAFAAPTAEYSVYPYSIGDISIKHLMESNTWDMTWSVTSRDRIGTATGNTTCHTAWNDGASPVGTASIETCTNTAYKYWFPNGVNNVESYKIIIEGPAGSASADIESGYKYQCGVYSGTVGNIDKECKIINGGEFYLRQ